MDDETLRRAVLYSQLPGVTRDQACSRYGIPRRRLTEGRRHARRPSRHELVLSALTHSGAQTSGTLRDAAGIASYVDWQNHDGTRAEDVLRMLDELVERGVLTLDGDRWELLGDWP